MNSLGLISRHGGVNCNEMKLDTLNGKDLDIST